MIRLDCFGYNQRNERVLSVRRTVLVPKRNHPTMGEGAEFFPVVG